MTFEVKKLKLTAFRRHTEKYSELLMVHNRKPELENRKTGIKTVKRFKPMPEPCPSGADSVQKMAWRKLEKRRGGLENQKFCF